ncbi:YveK family protein [Listeria kieliensis]|uniref:Capsular biosynthesis protein n=1 Tax=Listeria kieliensis TaxID=1621700 RepID=A0A3D8TS45_9LIST|nr:Wzz/FepE/Etk N-terminal domain-containing protein [Listeria kieliensis]RDX01239.1 capsular biosynthesis protein [Listeria kieliensis]
MNQEFSVSELIYALLKHKWTLTISSVVGLLCALFVSLFLITPSYQMTSQVLVVPSNTEESAVSQNAEVQANLQMINTYKALIKSPKVLNKVNQELENKFSVGELKESIQPITEENSQIINIVVTSSDSKDAAIIANTVAKEFVNVTPQMMKANNLELLDQANVNANVSPIFPRNSIFALGGLILGFLGGIIIVACITIFSNKVKSEADLADLDTLVLGTIGRIKDYYPE